MANISDITVDVKARMYVPKATAVASLALVTLYLNEHPDKILKWVKAEDGSIEYRIVESED